MLKYFQILLFVRTINTNGVDRNLLLLEPFLVEAYDLTTMAEFDAMLNYYKAVSERKKSCDYCGYPDLGTVMHLQYGREIRTMPADLKMDNLVTRLLLVNLTELIRVDVKQTLTKGMVRKIPALKSDPREPTLLLLQFGWKPRDKIRQCNCSHPGLSYKAAKWIASKLSHVTGVATDVPSLESVDTREDPTSTHTVANALGSNGIFMIENVFIPNGLPENRCMSISLPQKVKQPIVPARLTAYCPVNPKDEHVIITATSKAATEKLMKQHYVELDELLGYDRERLTRLKEEGKSV